MNDKLKEYWHIIYYETDDLQGECEEKQTCIARHPDSWLKCKTEHNDGMISMGTDWYIPVSFEIVHATRITESDYESYMSENEIRGFVNE